MIEEQCINISEHNLLSRVERGLGEEADGGSWDAFPEEVALCLLLCWLEF